jgi:methylmalonyl-CoA mutase, N-terminal domain
MSDREKGGDATARKDRADDIREVDRGARFTTVSGHPIRQIYSPEDLRALHSERDLGVPGAPPYTRGIHASMYRGKLWTMRQFAGFGSAQDSNERYRYLLEHGQTGLSVAFDLPTLMGYDSDHALAHGEVGKCGVAVSSLDDMEALFEGIRLPDVATSMTINGPAAVLWAMYLVVAEKQGADWKRLSGTLQNDILKEYIAQKEYIFPPEPSLRLVVDTIEFGARHVPRYNPISISGYHIREAGSTAIQELAFTLRDGIEYVERALRRGLAVDEFAPRLSFFFNAHNDFFEEIAKYRAARRIWYHVMRERFGAKEPRSWALRFHAQTAGCSLTAQQPYNNVVRTGLQALAAVLGGTQSLHTNSLDEALALPSEFAATLALRTQQIIAYESGVANTADPFGGSYFLETLTGEVERGALDYITKIDALGGMVAAIENTYPQREIADASYQYQMAIDRKEKIVVGVNGYVGKEEASGAAAAKRGSEIAVLQIDESAELSQRERLRRLREQRSGESVRRRLDDLRRAAEGTENLMPFLCEAVKSYATLGEICDSLRGVFGTYDEVAVT